MSNVDVTRDHPARPLPPIDPSVRLPESVKRAAQIANDFYAKSPEPAPAPDKPVSDAPPVDQNAAPPAPVEPAPVESVATAPKVPAAPLEPSPQRTEPDTDHKVVTEESWEHRYLSMQGRFQASQRTIGSMQEQMQQLGDELVRTQQLLQHQTTAPVAASVPAPKLLTAEDEQTYGPELIDLAQRAAMQVVKPELDNLRTENTQLKQQVERQSKGEMYAELTAAIPKWREINKNPRFVRWLSLRDIYSGGVRQQMLNAAVQAAEAPRVIAFFQGFLRDEAATGNADPAPLAQPQDDPAPRVAAVPLDSLAAPGRARPASGDTQVPADKPIFTRQQIAQFYTNVRTGAYSGRDADKARDEAQIFAAQREGRVR